jgi:L-ascorbate metabolism protein UlaG (beta-lactamase superfamily)
MGELRVTFINHSTVLIQLDGLNILTDPVWSDRVGPVQWAGPHRVRPPGLRMQDLPHIDVVLISHNHYDHLDLPSLQRIAADHHPRILAPLGNRLLLESSGIEETTELDWWECETVGNDVIVTAVPAQHFSMRGLCDRDQSLWSGFVIQGAGGPVYFAGDTGFGPHVQEIREQFGPMRLALLPIGAFNPRWVMAPIHMSPEEAVHAHGILAAATSIAIHFGTFRQADDGEFDPLTHLAARVAQAPLPKPRFWVLGFGQGVMVPAMGTAAH